MLEALLGNETCEKILLYLASNKEGYASGIARAFAYHLRRVQLQLDRLERGGIIVSRTVGRTRVYQMNPKWYFYPELLALLQKALRVVPTEERDRYLVERRRPRKKGKDLWPSPKRPRS